MISIIDFFGKFLGHPDATNERIMDAEAMLEKVNALLLEAEANGVEIQTNPHTHTCVSGETYGGFRPQDCPLGAPHSSHKLGRAVDIYDPTNDLDRWITDARLEAHDLYRESPGSTPMWAHLSDKMPASGKRTFTP